MLQDILYGEALVFLSTVMVGLGAYQFKIATEELGSVLTNILKGVIAIFFLSSYCYLAFGEILPFGASWTTLGWLFLAGSVGFALCDYMLFKSYLTIGVKLTYVITSLSPICTAFISVLFLNEILSLLQVIGIFVTILGVIITTYRPGIFESVAGIRCYAFGFCAMIATSFGFIFIKVGVMELNGFQGSQVRLIVGVMILYAVFILARSRGQKKEKQSRKKLSKRGLRTLLIGSLLGPTLAVSLSFTALQRVEAGKFATIYATLPLITLVIGVLFYDEELTLKDVMGMLTAFSGLGMVFLL